MTKRLIVLALGLAVVVAVSLPLVFHAQPRSPQPAATAAATPSPVPAAASPAPQHHPRIDAAINHLQQAKHELEECSSTIPRTPRKGYRAHRPSA